MAVDRVINRLRAVVETISRALDTGKWLAGYVPIMPTHLLREGVDLYALMATSDSGFGRVVEVQRTHSTVMWKTTKGTKFKPHYHNCLEIIVMKQGLLHDIESDRTAGPGQMLVYEAGHVHAITALQDSEYFVTWLAPSVLLQKHDGDFPDYFNTDACKDLDLLDYGFIDPKVRRGLADEHDHPIDFSGINSDA